MANPVSALEHQPHDFIREVSPEAINFYVEELSGIYLPDDFKKQQEEVYDVKCWKPEDRLHGKFGRFTIRHAEESTEQDEFADILLMGTTLGVAGLDHVGDFSSLQHMSFRSNVRHILNQRGLVGEPIRVNGADYGGTTIVLGENGDVEAIKVDGSSLKFGRASSEGRQQTCEVFEQLLGTNFKVINVDPEPTSTQRIVSPIPIF